jgi:hypothetical protein
VTPLSIAVFLPARRIEVVHKKPPRVDRSMPIVAETEQLADRAKFPFEIKSPNF